MSRTKTITSAVVLTVAAVGAAAAAWFAADYVERSSRADVAGRLDAAGLGWVDVQTDGLQLILAGVAPDERARFRAVTETGRIVDPGRIIDGMDVAEREALRAPRFALEILRNEAEISLIGLTPARETQGGPLLDLLARPELSVTDMVDQVAYDMPEGWIEAVSFATEALDLLPRAKISVEPGAVAITAVADSDEDRRRLETRLTGKAPDAVTLALDIAAPRPVITPFTLRFVMPPDGAPRFEACAVDSPAAERAILQAAVAAGYDGEADCVMGLGVPSASWGAAAAAAIETLGILGGGSVTLSDADVTLVVQEGTAQEAFDTAVAELETALPDIFVLSSVLPQTEDDDAVDPAERLEFVATLSPEGQVQLRGKLYDDTQQVAVLSYARALFGVQDTYIATLQTTALPEGWPARVLVALDALSRLQNGAVVVRPDLVVVRGVTGNPRAQADISRILSDKLGPQEDFRIDVTYREELDPLLNIPTPEECADQLNEILLEQKLTFAPGEAVIEAAGDGQIGRLTEKLDACKRAVFEVGGHTDSQGRESMNLDLSQARAEAVRTALIARGTPPTQLVAKGYGESEPVADNGTEAGREANRRITFTLVGVRDQGDEQASDTTEAGPADAQPATTGEAASETAPEGETDEGADQ
ncbi:membrane protein [Jannaschia pagri]|uniref:Membrane protein n=1 Tax=Jannaschia pagri TaxID=2829797 RepID=A0ABQ4NI98_9RHOB|nr:MULTISPECIES: OmpA family protein [unclassified Jannaschia]GIT89746.1 membrane protein [Jannaschia sp. AI_61]GIT94146.1 membrane protein [Jannaschia sp. AI_62]